jgi:hypothetical protein
VLGTGAREIDATGRVVRPLKRPESHDYIACEMLFRCVMIHPTVMGRAEVFKKIPYQTGPAEDYGLWIEMLEQGVKLGNVRSALLDYRMHAQNMSTTKWNAQTLGMWNDQREYLNRLFSRQVSEQEFRLHSLLFATPEEMPDGKVDWKGLSDWVKALMEANEKANALNRNALISTLWVAWCSLAKKTGSLEWDALPKFHPIDYHSLTYVTHYLLPQ